MTARTKNFDRSIRLLALCAIVMAAAGCRQAPAESPRYYQSELEQMRREERKAKNVEPVVKDWYPWRGKPPLRPQPSLPQRISIRDKELAYEIEYLNEVVRGRKKVKVRFRD
ncbi:MAG TPA: hypothetical protein DCG57_12560 [Candidatus Riflebacteria bacterium]|jgi:hypothetical protein|nr:hypothetical protein [Candidatus Riflebacteria bacterium]